MDFLDLDWRADARVRFAMAKTPVFALFGMVRRAHTAQSCEPAERYPRSVTLSRIIFLSVPIALIRG
jgi:hypothetical protein